MSIQSCKPMIDPTMSWNLKYVQRINREVADHLFPERSFTSMMLKTHEELGEMVKSPTSAEECADVIIMMLDHMDRLEADSGIEILAKLTKNLGREWGMNHQTHVFRHVNGEADGRVHP